jgi:hypothetical protein
MKQLIKERAHPLDLLRELVSNSGAKEVGATEIRIRYTVDDEGHIFEVRDDGCGMNYTNNQQLPGRLDKFLGLGLSNVVGVKSDEFSWKGLGSKLAYQSRKIEIETWCGTGPAIRLEVNEPWSTLERNLRPKPKVYMIDPEEGQRRGTSVKVYGHPPHSAHQPFTIDAIRKFLLHRTFVGFTRVRDNKPRVFLSVLGQTEELDFGFPELRSLAAKEGTAAVEERGEAANTGGTKRVHVTMKGLYTWDAEDYGLDRNQMNTGLILSVKGIPYFELDMEKYGSRSLRTANPGVKKCCLVLECDEIQEDMNIARSGLVDSEATDLLVTAASRIFARIESGKSYLAFRQIPETRKTIAGAGQLEDKKRGLEKEEQRWVTFQRSDGDQPVLLAREPENENDTLCMVWKLEALGALPFAKFQTLGHGGKGPDLLVHFQEDKSSSPERYATVEVESRFYNYKAHGHNPSQFVRILCWEIGKTPKKLITKTDKPYKSTVDMEDFQLHIYSLRLMPGIRVLSRKELRKLEIEP